MSSADNYILLIIVDNTEPLWVRWSHKHGFITRYKAHGSPGNLLDLYAVADVPETEFFAAKRNPLVSKFASSTTHVKGGNLVTSETGAWLAEHFTETLAEMKWTVDDMFLSGVNHVFLSRHLLSTRRSGLAGLAVLRLHADEPAQLHLARRTRAQRLRHALPVCFAVGQIGQRRAVVLANLRFLERPGGTPFPTPRSRRNKPGLKTSPSGKPRMSCGTTATPSTTCPTGNC